MQLTQFSDYALRTLIYLSVKNELCTITEISRMYGISKNHLMKVVNKLSQLNVIETTRGNQGGIRLKHEPKNINIGELIKKIEPNFHTVECFDRQNNRCIISPACKLKKILHEATENFIASLCQYTLADITENKSSLNNLLKKK